jgi:hypothetical protein
MTIMHARVGVCNKTLSDSLSERPEEQTKRKRKKSAKKIVAAVFQNPLQKAIGFPKKVFCKKTA